MFYITVFKLFLTEFKYFMVCVHTIQYYFNKLSFKINKKFKFYETKMHKKALKLY